MKPITKLLPLETIDQIIGAVADNDNNDQTQYQFEMRDVKACSLTCRTLATVCWRHIYHSVRVFDCHAAMNLPFDATKRPLPFLASSFGKLITDRPEIANHVRELVYCIRALREFPVPVEFGGLKKLQKISVHADGVHERKVDWPTLVYSAEKMLLFELMHQPTVTSLELNSVEGFNISDLVACANLKCLALQCCKLASGNASFPPDRPNNPIKLRELEVSPHTELLSSLLERKYDDGTPILDTRELKKVTIGFWLGDNDDDVVHNVIKFLDLTTDLEVLQLLQVATRTMQNTEGSEFIPRILSTPLRTLRTLHLDLFVWDRLLDSDAQLEEVPNIIKNISAHNRIERLNLAIYVQKLRQPRQEEPENHWKAIKACISLLQWPALVQVDLKISSEYYEYHGPSHAGRPRQIQVRIDDPRSFIRLSTTQDFVEVPYIGS